MSEEFPFVYASVKWEQTIRSYTTKDGLWMGAMPGIILGIMVVIVAAITKDTVRLPILMINVVAPAVGIGKGWLLRYFQGLQASGPAVRDIAVSRGSEIETSRTKLASRCVGAARCHDPCSLGSAFRSRPHRGPLPRIGARVRTPSGGLLSGESGGAGMKVFMQLNAGDVCG